MGGSYSSERGAIGAIRPNLTSLGLKFASHSVSALLLQPLHYQRR